MMEKGQTKMLLVEMVIKLTVYLYDSKLQKKDIKLS